MKDTPICLIPSPNRAAAKGFNAYPEQKDISIKYHEASPFNKSGSLSAFRRSSSSAIITPITPKPSLSTMTGNEWLGVPGYKIQNNDTCKRCDNNTEIIQTLQQSLSQTQERAKSLENELKKQQEAKKSLEADYHVLNAKYTRDIGRLDDIAREKNKLEHELEDLTVSLFQQANEMVAHQKRIARAVEADNQRLCKELSDTLQRLVDETSQLTELKEKIRIENDSYQQSQLDVSHQDITDALTEKKADTVSSCDLNQLLPAVTTLLSQPILSTPAKYHYSLAYIKRSQIEDVEPCLWFGNQSIVSAKKIIQAIHKRSCFIEGHNGQMSERRPSTWLPSRKMLSTQSGCLLCLGNQSASFRFRLSEKNDWIYIDQACRQKLVAVCEYYAFIRNILDGLYCFESKQKLYDQSVQLKSKMFQARFGIIFDGMPTARST
ncbi:hypothetical protein INT43_000237 [Umbelopsis isabellina]|uniref:GDP/GTP exchange factor Sec2 N-terminal domain-containing protein n=1 Tax=Mortierella isabellina TaxID=91625 RepID=A0A8H7PFA6_MORIS|nr:hypothetical protein INT43_000237 [Umbelopsis isabellina]